MNRQKSRNGKNKLNSYARFSGIAFQMIAIILLGTFAGMKLDRRFPNEFDLWTIILTFIAVIISVVTVIRSINRATKNNE